MLGVATVLSSTLLVAGCSLGTGPSFTQNVQPILKKHCAECHLAQGEGAQKSGFRVDSYASIMQGTKFGPVVIVGAADSSSLYRLIAGKVDKSIQMPHGRSAIPATEIATIEQWIDQGAKND